MVANAPYQVVSAPGLEVARRLFLIWQNPDSRKFVRVGVLSELADGRYAFEYTEDAISADGFYPLAQFPDMRRIYVSNGLPAFFVNRLMSRKRESFASYLQSLGIDSAALDTPMELLARTGGPRETDTFHIVDDLMFNADGALVSRFLASGVRHIEGSSERLSSIKPGDRLFLRASPENPVNKRAQLICVTSGDPVGYVPDWLLDDLENLQARSSNLNVIAERVNPDAHPHLRLLCRVEATTVR